MEAGVFAPADPRAAASVLWAMVHGVVSLELAGRPKRSRARMSEEAVSV
jgi:hypothetical protein